jgi:hypothetical protein
MRTASVMNHAFSLSVLLASFAASVAIADESATRAFKPDILKTWDDDAIASLEIPLAEARFSPKHTVMTSQSFHV